MQCFPRRHYQCHNTERDNTGLRYSNPNTNNDVTSSVLVVRE